MRRLTTILFSDIHGFSRQMSVDEAGMLKRLAEHNRIFEAEVAAHDGRIVKRTGDGFMVEFSSAVSAVTCGIAIQRALSRRSLEQPEEPPIAVRIGVHLGDVIVSADGDLLGDAVNIAARLEQICPVGSVCVSHSVYEQARGKINAEGESLGHVRLKNIARKVRVYVLHPADARLTVSGVLPKLDVEPKRKGGSHRLAIAAGVLVVLVAAGLLAVPALRSRRGTPERGGVLRVASTLERGQLRVYGGFRGRYSTALDEVMEPLVATEGSDDPAVLERVEESADGKSLQLWLRPGVRFHDHPCLKDGKGRPAGADDVLFSVQEALRADGIELELQKAELADACPAGAPAQDACHQRRHVRLELVAANAFYADELARVMLLPRDLEGCESIEDLQQPVGTGPLRFTRAATTDDLLLERFDGSWRLGLDGAPLPYLDRLELRHEADLPRALSRLARGELDAVTFTLKEADAFIELTQAGPRLKGTFADLPATVAPHMRAGITFAALYLTGREEGPLARTEARRALSLALNRDRLVKALAPGLVASARLLEPRMMGATAERTTGADPVAARKALGDTTLPGEILVAHTSERREVCGFIAEDARAAGLPLRCMEVSLAAIGDSATQKTFDAFLSSSAYDTRGTEPWPYLATLATNADYRDRPATPFETVVARLTQQRDRTARAPLYRELETALLQRLSVIPIGIGRNAVDTYQGYWVIRKGVEGLIDPRTGRVATEPRPFSNVWIAAQ